MGSDTFFFKVPLAILILELPFTVCSLYYAYNDTTCVLLPITKYSISFDLSGWLKVDGFCDVGLYGFMLLAMLAVAFRANCNENAGYCYMLTVLFVAIFKFIWNIIGSVMFWGALGGIFLIILSTPASSI
jgi:hypothetical protein